MSGTQAAETVALGGGCLLILAVLGWVAVSWWFVFAPIWLPLAALWGVALCGLLLMLILAPLALGATKLIDRYFP